MRIPKEWRRGIDTGKIVILSPFGPSQHWLTAALCDQRNRMVVALADQTYFVYMAPDRKTTQLAGQFSGWGILEIG